MFGPRARRGRGRPRGDVRSAILLLLDERPRHGYELIQAIAERSSGAWTPSPGSIYPSLQALEDEGLVALERVEGRRTASLTEDGTDWVAANRDQLGDPFATSTDDQSMLTLRAELGAVRDAVGQVVRVGTADQQAAAAATLVTARRELYRLLAEDGAPTS